MSDSITGLERDVILYVFKTEKPELILEFQSSVNKRDSLKIFDSNYSYISEGILFFQIGNDLLSLLISDEVKIRFFYKGRGIYFSTKIKRMRNGYALVIPPTLNKSIDAEQPNSSAIKGRITYGSNSSLGINCVSSDSYPLLDKTIWLHWKNSEILGSEKWLNEVAGLEFCSLPPETQSIIENTKKILYIPDKKIPDRNYFPYDASITINDLDSNTINKVNNEIKKTPYFAYIPFAESSKDPVHSILGVKTQLITTSPLDIEDIISVLPISRFLGNTYIPERSVKGRAESLQIISLTDSSVVFGVHDSPLTLQKNQEYTFSLYCSTAIGYRIIQCGLAVSRTFENESGSKCALCRFIKVKEEDRRFLFEKYFGKIYK
jgi:hypothetical protein